MNAVIPVDGLKFTKGSKEQLSVYADNETSSGKPMERVSRCRAVCLNYQLELIRALAARIASSSADHVEVQFNLCLRTLL